MQTRKKICLINTYTTPQQTAMQCLIYLLVNIKAKPNYKFRIL